MIYFSCEVRYILGQTAYLSPVLVARGIFYFAASYQQVKNTEFIINLISLFLAHTLSIVIFGVIIKRITPYPKNDTIEYIFVLLICAIIVFLYFSARINFTKRDRTFEFTSTLKNCLLTYGLFGAMLILTKNPIIDSRYLFLSSFIFYIFFSLIGRYFFKHYMIKKIKASLQHEQALFPHMTEPVNSFPSSKKIGLTM